MLILNIPSQTADVVMFQVQQGHAAQSHKKPDGMPDLDLEKSQEDGDLKKVWYSFKHKKQIFSHQMCHLFLHKFFYKLIWKFHYTDVHLK